MGKGYSEFISFANDLAMAKEERVKSQYYTGSPFMREQFKERSIWFLKEVVMPYLAKIIELVGD